LAVDRIQSQYLRTTVCIDRDRNDQASDTITSALAIGHMAFEAMTAERNRGGSSIEAVSDDLMKAFARL
jgi:hypothetical protein